MKKLPKFNLANKKIQLDDFVDLKKLLQRMRAYLQKSVPIQPKTSEIVSK